MVVPIYFSNPLCRSLRYGICYVFHMQDFILLVGLRIMKVIRYLLEPHYE